MLELELEVSQVQSALLPCKLLGLSFPVPSADLLLDLGLWLLWGFWLLSTLNCC